MGFDTAYEAIAEESGDQRWAFGTGFEDPLAGVDTAVPDGVSGADLAAYSLMLGDDALIMSHRLQQWLARAPELEEETALANIALDLLGQARLLLTRAGHADGTGRDEDHYAFRRAEAEFRNVRLAEVTDADFAGLIARLLVFSTWRLALLDRLRSARDPVLAAVAAKGVQEVAYHRDYAAQWLLRLAGGTAYSRDRTVAALAAIAPLTPDLFTSTDIERRLTAHHVAIDPATLRPEFDAIIAHVLDLAKLSWPDVSGRLAVGRPAAGPSAAGQSAVGSPAVGQSGVVRPAAGPSAAGPSTLGPPAVGPSGRDGVHTEAMGPLLAELQSVARALPGATW
jgi:ring-1,2-phenylacetyl-CoA epoxidase subunit PaaC